MSTPYYTEDSVISLAEMWRCAECGKWSHAKRKPLRHKRWWTGVDDPPEERVAEFISGGLDPDMSDGFYVWCGPFDRWLAARTDGDLP